MAVILILILASLVVATGFLGAFVWAVRSGQYEDVYTPSLRPLMDEPPGSQAEAADQTQGLKNGQRQSTTTSPA